MVNVSGDVIKSASSAVTMYSGCGVLRFEDDDNRGGETSELNDIHQ